MSNFVMNIVLPKDKNKRMDLYLDYKSKLERLLPNSYVLAFDPGFCIEFKKAFMMGENKIEFRYDGNSDIVTFHLAHLILKSHNLHNPDIENFYEHYSC